jgi:methyl-accepting chemotaxis protein
MEWFNNIKISTKLFLAFSLMILLMVGLGGAGYLNVSRVSGNLDQIYQVRMPSLDYLLQVDRDLQQALVAERSLLLAAPGTDGFAQLMQDYDKNLQQAAERWTKVKGLLAGSEGTKLASRYDVALQAWRQSSRQVLDLCRRGTPEARETALARSLGTTADLFAAMRGEIEQLVELVEKTARREADSATQVSKDTVVHLLGFLLVAVLAAAVVGWLLYRVITRPLRAALHLAEDISRGDLSRRLDMQHRDETGQLVQMLDVMADNLARHADLAERIAHGDLNADVKLASDKDQLGKALKNMTEYLNELVGQVQLAVEQINTGSTQVSDSSQTLSQGATESAASLEEITASMTQMASQTKLSAQNADQANSLSKGSRNAAARSDRLMKELVEAMGEIDRSGQDIQKIIKVIDEIAFQTNLLALNAAVEAAHAGQHGKGFAVVAEEVRNLAARSAKAAKETEQLIEGSAEKTHNGSAIADKTAAALRGIVAGAAKVSDLVGEIAAAANEQAAGFEQVSRGLGQIDQVTQQNTANAEESAAAAEELTGQAGRLKDLMARFKIRGGVRAGVRAVQTRASRAKPSGQADAPKPALSWQGDRVARSPKKAAAAPAPGNVSPREEVSDELAPEQIIALDDQEFGKY